MAGEQSTSFLNDDCRYRPALPRDLALIAKAATRAFRLAGRARRTEFGVYVIVGGWIFGALVALLNWAIGTSENGMASILLWAVYLVPIPALVVRRLHDMNFTGWLSLAFLIPAAVSVTEDAIKGQMMPTDPNWSSPFGLAGDISSPVGVFLLFLLLLVPARGAPNRFGPDPRLA